MLLVEWTSALGLGWELFLPYDLCSYNTEAMKKNDFENSGQRTSIVWFQGGWGTVSELWRASKYLTIYSSW